MSLCPNADLACCTASDGVHFRPVDKGSAALLMTWSLESSGDLLALVFLRKAGERKLKNSFSIENSFSIPFPDVSEALMDLKPFLSIRGDGSLYLLHSCYGTSQIVIGHIVRSKSPKLEIAELQFAGQQGLVVFQTTDDVLP